MDSKLPIGLAQRTTLYYAFIYMGYSRIDANNHRRRAYNHRTPRSFELPQNKLGEQVKRGYSGLMHFASTSLLSVSATIRYESWDKSTPEQTKSLHGLV